MHDILLLKRMCSESHNLFIFLKKSVIIFRKRCKIAIVAMED